MLDRVRQSGDSVILERSGEPVAVVVPLELYERLVAEQDAPFGVLDRIRDRVPDLPTEEVEQDVAEAVRAVRSGATAES